MNIAVLIPVYNAERYLAECLDSVLKQTYSGIRIFCCDDGSTDGSLRILEDYAARFSTVHVMTQTNSGVSATRNRLMDELPEEIEAFGFLDSDDTVRPEMYTKLAEALMRTEADVAECEWKREERVIDDMSIFILRETAPGGWINVVNKLYRRTSVGPIRFRAGLSFEEDFFFNFEIHQAIHRKVLVPGSYYYYRPNPHSATSRVNYRKYVHSALERVRLSSEVFLKAGRIPERMVTDFRKELAKDAYRMCIRKNLKKNRDAKSRRELFAEASEFFCKMERDHGFEPVGLNLVQRFLYVCCCNRLYVCARLAVLFT